MAYVNQQEEFSPWARAAQNIGHYLAQTPMLRAQMAEREQVANLRRAQTETEGAQAENYRAQSRKTDAETARLARIGAAVERMGKNAPKVQHAFETGDFSDPAVDEGIGDMAIVTGTNRGDISKFIRSMASAGMVSKAGTNMSAPQLRTAAALDNPASVANAEAANASREKIAASKPLVVQPGGTVLPPNYIATMLAPYMNPSAASRAQDSYETTTEIYPPTTGQPEVPAVPPRSGFLGIGSRPGVPAQPAVPAQPEKRVVRKLRIPDGATATATNQPPTVAQPATAMPPQSMPQSPPNAAPVVDDELVPVINPQGKPVRIRKSQLQEALQKGYQAR